MSGKSVHFEVFTRRSAKGAWSLVDAIDDRAKAIKRADEAVASGAATGAKVVKETLNHDTGQYLTLKIHEAGDALDTGKVTQKKEAEIPCFKPQDLYGHHPRSVITRLLADQLAQWRVTALEVMHRADMLEQLEASGTIVQHAIQKAAIAHAQSADEDVQSAVKKLNELVGKAIERVYKDDRAKRFNAVKGDRLDKLAAKVASKSDAEYLLCAGIAASLTNCAGWRDRLSRVLSYMNHLPEKGPERELCLTVIDMYVAEMVDGNAALSDLLGDQDDLGSSLTVLADVFLGKVAPDSDVSDGVKELAGQFKQGNLPSSRTAIAHRIIRELKSVRRLIPSSLEDEIKLVKTLATKMVMGQGKLLTIEEITDAFTQRSKRLVANDVIDDYLAGVSQIDDKMEKLIQFEENIVGAENKRKLATAIKPILTSHKAEGFFLSREKPVMWRLRRLGELQRRVEKSGLQDLQKREISEAFGALAAMVEEREQLISQLNAKQPNPAQRVFTLLKFATSDDMPKGPMMERVRLSVMDTMASAEFRQELATSADVETQLEHLKELLKKAGFERRKEPRPETSEAPEEKTA